MVVIQLVCIMLSSVAVHHFSNNPTDGIYGDGEYQAKCAMNLWLMVVCTYYVVLCCWPSLTVHHFSNNSTDSRFPSRILSVAPAKDVQSVLNSTGSCSKH